MPDYSKSKIYKIVCNIAGLIYIGSTSQPLCRRIQDHKNDYKRYLNGKHNYVSSFKILENDNYNIILVEDFPCETKEQLHARERYWIENTECVNIYIPTRTDKEYYEQNKEKLFEQRKNITKIIKKNIVKLEENYQKSITIIIKNKSKRKKRILFKK